MKVGFLKNSKGTPGVWLLLLQPSKWPGSFLSGWVLSNSGFSKLCFFLWGCQKLGWRLLEGFKRNWLCHLIGWLNLNLEEQTWKGIEKHSALKDRKAGQASIDIRERTSCCVVCWMCHVTWFLPKHLVSFLVTVNKDIQLQIWKEVTRYQDRVHSSEWNYVDSRLAFVLTENKTLTLHPGQSRSLTLIRSNASNCGMNPILCFV